MRRLGLVCAGIVSLAACAKDPDYGTGNAGRGGGGGAAGSGGGYTPPALKLAHPNPIISRNAQVFSFPAGGAATLQAGMKNTVDNLSGPFLTQPNESYEVSFANAPKGTYKGYCTPHLTLGMKLTIKVE